MKSLSFLLAVLAIPYTLAQQQTAENQDSPNLTTQTMTMLDASGSTMTATLTLVNSATNSNPSLSAQDAATPTTTSAPSITSIIQATRTESRYIPTASSGTEPHGVDVEGGASGSSSSGFSLSRGGMIAVIVVVVCVAVFGVLSITLFILAKKRQWKVRESIKRASRRLTGRSAGPRPRSEVERRKRSGVVAGAQRSNVEGSRQQQKATRVSETEMRDLERGEGAGGKGNVGGGGGWLGRMGDNNWR